MTRYKFLVGKWWTTRCPPKIEAIPVSVQVLPYQNVKRGGKLPAVMFHTGDSDAVDPLHARKMTAHSCKPRPAAIVPCCCIEAESGHGFRRLHHATGERHLP
jgi:prolyl oligopeptidase PreP (S9A serine peptidase family)